MLLYAKTDEKVIPNQVNTICNNRFTIRTLDLTDNFEKVKEQLDDIAYQFTNNELEKTNI